MMTLVHARAILRILVLVVVLASESKALYYMNA